MFSAAVEPVSARQACRGFRQCAELRFCDGALFWLASDPDQGTTDLWQSDAGGIRQLNTDSSVRSGINGYGGGAFAVLPGWICWVSDDQRLWSLELATGTRRLLVDAPGLTWGGLVPDVHRQRWLAVCEGAGRQTLMAIDRAGRTRVLHTGLDFYSAPAISADGSQIAWVSWQLPDMPWARSRLYTATVDGDGALAGVESPAAPAPGSVQQPQFVQNQLYVLSDHRGWWQPWQIVHGQGGWRWRAMGAATADHANAPWQLGECHRCPLPGGGWASVRYRQGIGELWLERKGEAIRLAPDCTDFRSLVADDHALYCIARRPDRLDAILRIRPSSDDTTTVFGGEPALGGSPVVLPESIVVPPGPGEHWPLQGFLYPAINGEGRSPLILVAHGGPTSAAYASFNPHCQFWCQRGFSVVEVNYTGSTGFGRAFRQALGGQWGQADVQDMMRMADYLGQQGRIDRGRVFIQGRSSGGYTALMAAMQPRARLLGLASLFGVTDPWRLSMATHRFESGYLDWLLGSGGENGVAWQNRTPALRAERIGCPALFFQGGQDRVVVPEQTRSMVSGIRQAGGQADLVWFANEGHGFRALESQVRVLETLEHFYGSLID